MKEQKIEIKVKPLETKTIKIKISGDKLMMDKFPIEVKHKILDKQTGKNKSAKENRDIKKEVELAIHKTSKGKIGYPSSAFKSGMVEATSFVGDKFFSKKLVKGSIKILNAEEGLIPIKSKKMDIVEHSIGPNTKFSPVFYDWECELLISYDAKNIAPEDIINLLNYAGFYFGVGAWAPRSKSSGEYGMYQVMVKAKP